MKKLFESLGLTTMSEIPVFKHVQKDNSVSDLDIEGFTKWCQDFHVSSLARSSEFTVIIGDHVKYVTLDRF